MIKASFFLVLLFVLPGRNARAQSGVKYASGGDYQHINRYTADSVLSQAFEQWMEKGYWAELLRVYKIPAPSCTGSCEGVRITLNFSIGTSGEFIPAGVKESLVCGKSASKKFMQDLYKRLELIRFPAAYAGKKYYYVMGHILKC